MVEISEFDIWGGLEVKNYNESNLENMRAIHLVILIEGNGLIKDFLKSSVINYFRLKSIWHWTDKEESNIIAKFLILFALMDFLNSFMDLDLRPAIGRKYVKYLFTLLLIC